MMNRTENNPEHVFPLVPGFAEWRRRRDGVPRLTMSPACLLAAMIGCAVSGLGCSEQSSGAEALSPKGPLRQVVEPAPPEQVASRTSDKENPSTSRTSSDNETEGTHAENVDTPEGPSDTPEGWTIHPDAARMVALKDWRIFKGADGSFEARWPGEPAHEQRVMDGVEMHRYHAAANNSMFLLNVQRPRELHNADDLKAELLSVADMLNAEILSASVGPWNGGQAIDATLAHQTTGDRCRCRILSRGDTVFALCALGESVPEDRKNPVGFFVGFTPLTAPGAAEGDSVAEAEIDTSHSGIEADLARLREAFEMLRPVHPLMDKLSQSRLPAWKIVAADGGTEARILLGLARFYGSGCEQDRPRAFGEIEEAATAGDSLAQYCMAWMEMESHGIGDSVRWLKRAAESDEGIALVFLGDMYRSGLGVEEDLERARELATRASQLGLAAGDDLLGRIAGAEGKVNEVFKHLGKAARAGLVDSQYTLASIMQYEQSDWAPARRVYWLREAADQGHVQAQCELAACLQTGVGAERDREQARHYREMAIAAGSVDARKQAIPAEIQNGIAACLEGNHQAEEAAVRHILAHFRTMQDSVLSPVESGQADAERELSRCLDVFLSTLEEPDVPGMGTERLRRIWIEPIAAAMYGKSSDAYLDVLRRIN